MKFKTRKKYRLTFVSENTLNTLWTLHLSRAKAWLLGGLCVAAIAALVMVLLGATPLGSILPGYMGKQQRRSAVESYLRVDSLAERQAEQTAWLDNVTAILAGTDSVAAEPDSEPQQTADTLMAASEAERKFVDAWTERERFNISVLTPIAASAMTFQSPASTCTVSDDGTLLCPRRATVMAINDGTVIDVHPDPACGASVVMVQHANDFISRYEGLEQTFVAVGDKLNRGHALGLLGSDGRLTLAIWRNGSPVPPQSIIAF